MCRVGFLVSVVLGLYSGGLLLQMPRLLFPLLPLRGLVQ